MRFAVHLGRVLRATVRHGAGAGRLSVIALVVLGLVVAAVALTAKAVVPLAVYPFA